MANIPARLLTTPYVFKIVCEEGDVGEDTFVAENLEQAAHLRDHS